MTNKKTANKFAEVCTNCEKGMNSGYYDDGNYLCCEKCLCENNDHYDQEITPFTPYTLEQWQKDCAEHPDECYWSEWEVDENDRFFDKDGNLHPDCKTFHLFRNYDSDLCRERIGEFYSREALNEYRIAEIARQKAKNDFSLLHVIETRGEVSFDTESQKLFNKKI